MKRIGLLLTILSCVTGTFAQTTTDSVKAAVQQLFEGMISADSAKVVQAFAPEAILQTITKDKNGEILIRTDKVDAFASFVAKQKAGAADERIVFETVRVDEALASVWTPYEFYFNGAFRHRGVNSFQLVRLNGVWKIQYLIDTRHK